MKPIRFQSIFPPTLRHSAWLLATAVLTAGAADETIQLQSVADKVGKFEKIEFLIHSPKTYVNPFDPNEVVINVRLTPPKGPPETVPAFWCQDYEHRQLGTPGQQRDWIYPAALPSWKCRFAPRQLGTYSAIAIRKDKEGTAMSQPVTFGCIASSSPGFIRVSQKDPRFLEFDNGKPFFAMGQNLAFIGPQQYVTPVKIEEIFSKLATNGANYLRIWTCCDDWALALEARKSAWGRSWDWHPPLASLPDPELTEPQYLHVSARSPTLKVDPSYAVSLRPRTRYLLSGKLRRAGNSTVRLEIKNPQVRTTLPPGPTGTWTTFQQAFETGPETFWLDQMHFQMQGTGEAWLDDLSLKETNGGPQLLWEAAINRPPRGFYNLLDAYLLDELVTAAERHGLYLQLCLLTRDLYMNALKDPESPEYVGAMNDAAKLLRYAVARWGYSTSVAAWEYWNEMNPNLPTGRFYAELGSYLQKADIYHHLRTTSTWGPSAKDCRHAQLDLADVHFYLRPSDKVRLSDEVDAVLDRTRWLREQAPHKPAHLGEFGLANEKWQPTEEMKQSENLADAHNALWASALSGASGTALLWWWERLDQRNVYPEYRPLSAFIADVPWNKGEVQPAIATVSEPSATALGLRARDWVWLWLFARQASWQNLVVEKRVPTDVLNAEMELQGLGPGTYHVEWWDTRNGRVIGSEECKVKNGRLRAKVPSFSQDIACQIKR